MMSDEALDILLSDTSNPLSAELQAKLTYQANLAVRRRLEKVHRDLIDAKWDYPKFQIQHQLQSEGLTAHLLCTHRWEHIVPASLRDRELVDRRRLWRCYGQCGVTRWMFSE